MTYRSPIPRPTASSVRDLADLDVWRELTRNELFDYRDDDARDFTPLYSTDDLIAEVDRRWGPDALERVATVVTGGHYSPDDELRLLDEHPRRFMALVRGTLQPEEWFDRYV